MRTLPETDALMNQVCDLLGLPKGISAFSVEYDWTTKKGNVTCVVKTVCLDPTETFKSMNRFAIPTEELEKFRTE